MIVRTPDNASREIFGGRCPYTGEVCDDWVCEICPTEKAEMVMMKQLDTEGADLSKKQFKYADNNVHQCWSCQNNEGQDIIKVPYGSDSNKIYVEFAIPECKVTGLYMEKVNRCPCPYYKQISEKSSEHNGERGLKMTKTLVELDKVLDIAMQYCPDDDGSCSKAGVDLREMLDEIEALPEIDGLSEAWRCDDRKLNDAIDCIHNFCKARKGKCIDCPAYITFRIESGDTVQTCKFRCDAPVNWEHLEIGGIDDATN